MSYREIFLLALQAVAVSTVHWVDQSLRACARSWGYKRGANVRRFGIVPLGWPGDGIGMRLGWMPLGKEK